MRERLWLAGWVMAAVGVFAGGGVLASAEAQDRAASASASASAGTSGRWTAEVRDGWRDARGERRVQLSLRSRDRDEHRGFGVPLAELEGLPPAAARDGAASNVTFRLVRDAGTLTFRGSFAGGRGAGDYDFSPNRAYTEAMAVLGYRDIDGERQLRLAVLDVSSAFAREIRDAGQSAASLDDLTRFRIHGVSGAVIRELAELGHRDLDADDLVRLRIHGATPERISGFRQAGLTGLSADDLVRLRIHGVTPEFIQGLKTRGYQGLDADDLTRMRIHGVSLDGIDALKATGLAGITADSLVRMRIHGVDAAFVRDARADGLRIRDADDAVDLAIHGRRFRRR